MSAFKKFCRDLIDIPKTLTFSDIAKAASKGISSWQNTPGTAWVGAILEVMDDAKRAKTPPLDSNVDPAEPPQPKAKPK